MDFFLLFLVLLFFFEEDFEDDFFDLDFDDLPFFDLPFFDLEVVWVVLAFDDFFLAASAGAAIEMTQISMENIIASNRVWRITNLLNGLELQI